MYSYLLSLMVLAYLRRVIVRLHSRLLLHPAVDCRLELTAAVVSDVVGIALHVVHFVPRQLCRHSHRDHPLGSSRNGGKKEIRSKGLLKHEVNGAKQNLVRIYDKRRYLANSDTYLNLDVRS